MFRFCRRSLYIPKRFTSTQAKPIVQQTSCVNQNLKYSVGDKVFGYTVRQVDEVPELQLAAVRLQHEQTGADHLHVARNDKNNLFSVALRTPPKNDKGITHILEHLALCGSQRFPCRDPFFKMRNRSLATFMNAYTGCDFTMYPFSSQNGKDFDNLLQVYLDAVFFPQLRQKDFCQEAWRLEHKDVSDKSSPIVFKGVVFNEMKGVFSDSSQHYARHLLNKLYPSDAYAMESGGNPLDIPSLTWEELKNYHSLYYHPSNSRFFTYGDLPLESHLEFIENYVLKKFSKIGVNSQVKDEVPWTNPKEERIHCAFDPMAAVPEKQTTVSVSYLLNKVTETYESFTMNILGALLVDGPNAPFYKTLLEPGIGADYSPWTGYDGQLKQGFFSVGLREISESDVDLVKNVVRSTFSDVIKNGFSKERVEGVLHNIELSLKHQTTNFGLRTSLGINALWNHGGNPISALKVNDHVNWFQKKLEENPHFLQENVEKYFQQNQHSLSLIMSPEEGYEKKVAQKEQDLLQSKLSSLSEEQKNSIFDEGISLMKYMQTPEDVSCLPTLKVSDVQKRMEYTDLRFETVDSIPVQLCEQPTNEITYFRAFSKVPVTIPENLLMLLPLFSEVVTKMGAGSRDYKELDQEAELVSGGLSAKVQLAVDPSHPEAFELGVLFHSHALGKNVEKMMSLWQDIFNHLTLHDQDRLSQLIKMSAAELSQSIPYHGHSFCMTKAASPLSLRSSIKEKMSGLTQVSFMKKLAETENCGDVIAQLQLLADIILNKNHLRCSLNANSDSMSSSFSSIGSFISSITEKKHPELSHQELSFTAKEEKTHFILPFAVNYISKCLPTVSYNHEDFASLQVAAQLLSFKFLHTEIREKGGAYGGGASLNSGGVFQLMSYRDPNVEETLNVFNSGMQWLLDGSYSANDIEEAKLGVFSKVDHPESPGEKGFDHFLHGLTDEMKQRLRERLFTVTKDDIVSVSQRYLINSKLSGTAVIGPELELTKKSAEWSIHKEQSQ